MWSKLLGENKKATLSESLRMLMFVCLHLVAHPPWALGR